MTTIEKYFKEADHTVIFGEVTGEEKVARTAVTGDTREIITVLLKLTVNTLKTANYDIDSYCYVLRELFLEESDAES
jgi:hypothetical protein